ncbi:hypothetical protein A3A55_02535 [Candidatus Roizmanbacteria bacterium RIFCSPLOWO2_01_FULL_40_14]|nr:MAG: hypothetical protein A3A55_02535 [Candidatus Roizmanbacteria bacterium RIFCSPLOWO2_01_FULL_40_14]
MAAEQGEIISSLTDIDTLVGIVGVPMDEWEFQRNKLEVSIANIPVPHPSEEPPEDNAIEMALQVRKLRILAVLAELAMQVPLETRAQRLQTLKSFSAKGIVKEETMARIIFFYENSPPEASPDAQTTPAVEELEAVTTIAPRGADGEMVRRRSRNDGRRKEERYAGIVADALINNFPQQTERRLTTSDLKLAANTTTHPSRYIKELKSTLEVRGFHLKEIQSVHRHGGKEKEYEIEPIVVKSPDHRSPQEETVIFSNPINTSADNITRAAVENGTPFDTFSSPATVEPDSGVKSFEHAITLKIAQLYRQILDITNRNPKAIKDGKLLPKAIVQILHRNRLLESWKQLDPAGEIPYTENVSMEPIVFAYLIALLKYPKIALNPMMIEAAKKSRDTLRKEVDFTEADLDDADDKDEVDDEDDEDIGDIGIDGYEPPRRIKHEFSTQPRNPYLKRLRRYHVTDDE